MLAACYRLTTNNYVGNVSFRLTVFNVQILQSWARTPRSLDVIVRQWGGVRARHGSPSLSHSSPALPSNNHLKKICGLINITLFFNDFGTLFFNKWLSFQLILPTPISVTWTCRQVGKVCAKIIGKLRKSSENCTCQIATAQVLFCTLISRGGFNNAASRLW